MGSLEMDVINVGHFIFECPDEETLIDFEADFDAYADDHKNATDKLLTAPDPAEVDKWFAEVEEKEAAKKAAEEAGTAEEKKE